MQVRTRSTAFCEHLNDLHVQTCRTTAKPFHTSQHCIDLTAAAQMHEFAVDTMPVIKLSFRKMHLMRHVWDCWLWWSSAWFGNHLRTVSTDELHRLAPSPILKKLRSRVPDSPYHQTLLRSPSVVRPLFYTCFPFVSPLPSIDETYPSDMSNLISSAHATGKVQSSSSSCRGHNGGSHTGVVSLHTEDANINKSRFILWVFVQPVDIPAEIGSTLDWQSSVPLQGPATWSSNDWSLSASLYKQKSLPAHKLERQATQQLSSIKKQLESGTSVGTAQPLARTASRPLFSHPQPIESARAPRLQAVDGVPCASLRRNDANCNLRC